MTRMLPDVTRYIPDAILGCQITMDPHKMKPAVARNENMLLLLTSISYITKQVVLGCDQEVARCDQLVAMC